MQTFRLEGDSKHLYFRNLERRSDREELAEKTADKGGFGCA